MRNLWVFEKKKIDPLIASMKALTLLGEYEVAMIREGPNEPHSESITATWKPPKANHFKLNIDAALPSEDKIGVGMIVRDEVGDIMMTASMGISLKCSPLEAEAQAILFGITLACDAGLRRLEIESDCLQLVKMLQGNIKEKSAAQFIVYGIISLTSTFESCSFDFCPRNCNILAHLIAKSSLDHNELRVLMEDCTPDVWPAVLGDKELI